MEKLKQIEKKYLDYANYYMNLINEKYKSLPDSIKIKKQHGLSMKQAVMDSTKNSKLFNESYFESAAIEGCMHDIGRFPQFYLSGTLNDAESSKLIKCNDHGEYGRLLLNDNNKKLLRYFLEKESKYDFVLTEVIGEHTTIRNNNYNYSINEFNDEFNNYSFEEVINSNNIGLKNKLIGLKLKILQEVDSLELLQNIISGAWNPNLSTSDKSDLIKDSIWDDFINFRYIDMSKYKKSNEWTVNSGFLLRYGLLTHKVNFVGTLKQFKESDSFNKIYNISEEKIKSNGGDILDDPKLVLAQEYIKLAIDNLINCSEDGILITPESREKAKQLTLKSL